MRKRICLAVLLLLASVAALVVANRYVDKGRNSFAFYAKSETGDTKATDGLQLDATNVCFPLRWESRLQFTDGGLNASTQSAYDDIYGHYYDYATAFETPMLQMDEIYNNYAISAEHPLYDVLAVRDFSHGGFVTSRVKLHDYFPYYPLKLTPNYAENPDKNVFDLTKLIQIKIPEDRIFSISGGYGGENIFNISCDDPVIPLLDVVSVPSEDGIYFSIVFAGWEKPEKSWAPQGFGIWFVPFAPVNPAYSGIGSYQCRDCAWENLQLVLPLDITTQRVAALDRSDDGQLLLTTCEDGMYHLRVLDHHNSVQQDLPMLSEAKIYGNRENYLPENFRFFGPSYACIIDTELYMGDGFMVLCCCDGRFALLEKESGQYRVAMIQNTEETEFVDYQYVASPHENQICMAWDGEKLATVSAFDSGITFHLRIYTATGNKLYDAQWTSSLSLGTLDGRLLKTPDIAWTK
ncbi:MAG: hypothetical protein Q3985_08115 [Eubacteriales bacterium]|nr:hypothetical protein [Eubacteriales bacterium]